MRQSQRVTGSAVKPTTAPQGGGPLITDGIPVTDWTQVRHTQAADCKRVSTVRAGQWAGYG